MPLITTLWEWHSLSCATFQLTMLSTCTSSACQWACYGRLYQRLVKVKINNIRYTPHVYQACIFNLIFIAECSQICQAWYPLHKSVLSVPSHFIFGNILQVHLICHLPRDWVEADFLKVLRNLSPSQWPFKNNWKWPHNYIGQLPQLLWIHPLRSHLFKYSQTWCCSMEGESLLLQTFPLVLEAWDPWILRVVKPRVKKTFTTLDFFVFSVIRSPASFSSGPPFSRLPFAADMSVEALLVDFCLLPDSTAEELWLPHHILVCWDIVSLSLWSHLSFPPLVRFLFMFEFSQELLVHLCKPLAPSVSLPTHLDGPFLSLEEVNLENQPILLNPLFVQVCLPWDSLKLIANQAKVCSPEAQGDVWFCYLPWSFMSGNKMNSSISWSL